MALVSFNKNLGFGQSWGKKSNGHILKLTLWFCSVFVQVDESVAIQWVRGGGSQASEVRASYLYLCLNLYLCLHLCL